jgi:hypothetical protein
MSADKQWYNHIDLNVIEELEKEVELKNFGKTKVKQKKFDDGTTTKESKKKRNKKRKEKFI